MDNRKREYLDKIAMYLFEDTDFEYVPNDKLCRVVVDTYFTTDCFTDWTYHDHTLIQDFCVEDYGLNEDEVKYVWRGYNKMIFDKVREIINTNRNLNESVSDKENMVIDKIVNFMLEDTKYKIKTNKGEPVAIIVYPFYGDEVYTESWDGVDYHLNFMGDYPLNVSEVNYISNQYGITDTSFILEIFNRYIRILFTKIRKELEDKMEDDSLNESIETNNKFLDKVVESLINDTKINTKLATILYPPINFHSSHMSLLLPSDSFYNEFADYCNKHYGITPEEFDVVWGKYSEIMFNKFDESDNILKESISNNKKKYLDKIVNFIVQDTKIDYDKKRVTPPFDGWSYQFHIFDNLWSYASTNFINYCNNQFGIVDEETEYVRRQYDRIIKKLIK